jgi:hypothetical protein
VSTLDELRAIRLQLEVANKELVQVKNEIAYLRKHIIDKVAYGILLALLVVIILGTTLNFVGSLVRRELDESLCRTNPESAFCRK